MKSLDEVIDIFEKACDLEKRCEDCPGCLSQDYGCPNDGAGSVPDALYYLKEYRDRIPRWIPVSERMPENDHTMAVRTVTQKGVVSWNRAWWDGEFWHGSGSMANVTHWMPISTEVA